MLELFLIGCAATAFLTIVFEEQLHINKANTTLFLGALAWVMMYISDGEPGRAGIHHELNENLLEIATLWLFLMSAMTFVTYLNRRGMIDNFLYLVMPEEISERKLFFSVAVFAFFFSSFCDNMTATLVTLAMIAPLGIEPKKMLKFATIIVFAINSGGVALITGDVTTLMIFMDGRVSMQDLVLLGVPALGGVIALSLMLCRGLDGTLKITRNRRKMHQLDYVIAGIFFLTILSTILFNIFFAIPPVLTFLLGLSMMFVAGNFGPHGQRDPKLLDYIRQIEFDTLFFFLGVLLIVGMLGRIGVLDHLTTLYEMVPPATANLMLGLLSAVIDNVPLTAAVLRADIPMSNAQWLGLTYAVGVGGSLLIIGSASGIVAMSKVNGLTFFSYMSNLGYLLLAYGVGYAGTLLIGRLVG